MKMLKRSWLLPAALIAFAGCTDEVGPLGTGYQGVQDNGSALAELDCQADLRAGQVACGTAEGVAPGDISAAIIAGQAVNVLLESSNISYASDIFSADVAVRNFLAQDLGTDSTGVRVFFLENPTVTAGSGSVTVANPTGQADFTGTGQDYFGYPGPLGPGERTEDLTWEWNVPASVDAFSFKVAVSAKVANEDDLRPATQLDPLTISSREAHSCALDLDGNAYCWGNGENGRLGNGDTENRTVPTPVAGGHSFASIDVGNHHTCALTETGEAYCWGANQYGRLGNGSTDDQSVPTPVETSLRFSQISSGESHTCALTTDGKAWCWGRGNFAKLGNAERGDTYFEPLPIPVETDLTFASITLGRDHSCALTADGQGYCWGNDGSGRASLGVGGRADDVTAMIGGKVYQDLKAGTTYSCGLTTDGEIYCFGINGSDMQGHGIDGLAQDSPVHPVAGGHKWVSMAVSHAHTCGITDGGELYCWGNSGRGRLGAGELDGNYGTPQKVLTDETFTEVVTGWSHTCATTTSNKVLCWGNIEDGRIGTGLASSNKEDDEFTPVLVSPIAD